MLDKYTSDEVCFADETNDTMELEGIELMRGLLHLRVGSKIKTAKDDVRMALLQLDFQHLGKECEKFAGKHDKRWIADETNSTMKMEVAEQRVVSSQQPVPSSQQRAGRNQQSAGGSGCWATTRTTRYVSPTRLATRWRWRALSS